MLDMACTISHAELISLVIGRFQFFNNNSQMWNVLMFSLNHVLDLMSQWTCSKDICPKLTHAYGNTWHPCDHMQGLFRARIFLHCECGSQSLKPNFSAHITVPFGAHKKPYIIVLSAPHYLLLRWKTWTQHLTSCQLSPKPRVCIRLSTLFRSFIMWVVSNLQCP